MANSTITKTIEINAPKKHVWQVMLDDVTYRQWTTVFCEGSYAVTDWKQGSKALFKTPDGRGMVSTILESEPYVTLCIKHLGVLTDGKEDMESDEAKEWGGLMENYLFTETDGVTTLTIEQDIPEEYLEWSERPGSKP